MADKTIVTNPDSSESVNPSGAGENHKEKENRIRDNLRSEYERKIGEEYKERLSSLEAEKAELESKVGELTAAEQKRLDSLNSNQSVVEQQIRELETNPEFAGYREKIVRESRTAKEQAVADSTYNTSKLLMEDFIAHKAESEKIDPKELRKELNSLLRDPVTGASRYETLLPHERARLAYRERNERKSVESILEENKRLKAERDGFSEGGQHQARSTKTHAELREAHIAGDFEAGMELAKNLDARQKEYDSQNK